MLAAQYQEPYLLCYFKSWDREGRSYLIFVQRMQEYFSKVQSQNTGCPRQSPGFFTSKSTKLYQREVYNKGVVLGTCSGQSHCWWSWNLAWTCQGNLCKRDFVSACTRACVCVHTCECMWGRGKGRRKEQEQNCYRQLMFTTVAITV